MDGRIFQAIVNLFGGKTQIDTGLKSLLTKFNLNPEHQLRKVFQARSRPGINLAAGNLSINLVIRVLRNFGPDSGTGQFTYELFARLNCRIFCRNGSFRNLQSKEARLLKCKPGLKLAFCCDFNFEKTFS
ncbi:hypothetical protein TcasGA2_TC015588 [Tribolium castaneum]|uniref:Uncharacterized protein n=1 Tax=Tribolium castaneum TaxID=7070 RepID=D2A5S7_TRICA|nr:hypothetical protein TcasGA2_TC015588 [Tribolium castaneum]